ncbi:MAG: ATP-binding protein [Polyangiaceae bacterium]|nr:ATP-binding protein [Polyangiaceae bacterium]
MAAASVSTRPSKPSTGPSSRPSTRPPSPSLAHLDFVGRCDDLVITGKSGTGKSHLLMAIGRRACEHQLYRPLRSLRRPAR